MSIRVPLIAAILSLCACAAMDLKQALSAADVARFHKVGVVSLLGDSVNGVYIGTTPLDSRRFTGAVPEWQIDRFVADQALGIIAAGGRVAAGRIDPAGTDLAGLRADRARRLWELARAQGFDTVVSVWPSVSENFPFFKPGYGLYDNSLLGQSRRCLFASYTVEVYDVASRRRIAWEWGGAAPCRMGADGGLVFLDGFDKYSDAQKQAMRTGIEARFAETLRYALVKLALADAPSNPP